jgi:hypothetical protein
MHSCSILVSLHCLHPHCSFLVFCLNYTSPICTNLMLASFFCTLTFQPVVLPLSHFKPSYAFPCSIVCVHYFLLPGFCNGLSHGLQFSNFQASFSFSVHMENLREDYFTSSELHIFNLHSIKLFLGFEFFTHLQKGRSIGWLMQNG